MKPVWALIARHDRSRFEIHLFSDAPESAMPEGYRADWRDLYHDISALENEAAARLIEENAIDVLVDLNGYSKLAPRAAFQAAAGPGDCWLVQYVRHHRHGLLRLSDRRR